MSSNKKMREIDTETPVIWPAWCYSGERDATTNDSNAGHHIAGNQLSATNNVSVSNRLKTKRKSIFTNPVDKLLRERMMTQENGKFCDNNSSNNIYYENKNKCENDYVLSVNNNNIKSERLSPQNGEVLIRNSRSRSATPSSYPVASPQPMIPLDNVNQSSQINSIISNKTEFPPRNYSDFIRSLAAKYNNSNPNEANNSRSNFFDPKFGVNSTKPTTKDSPLFSPDCKRLPTSQAQTITPQVPVSNQNTIMSSIFPGISFPSAVFSPLIDMSSTQALVTLARAAKETEMQNLLKNSTKKPNIELTPPHLTNNNSQQNSIPSHRNSGSQSFSSIASTFNQISSSSRSPLVSVSSASSRDQQQISSPLDLSATPVSKRLKLESPSPSRSIDSPISQHQKNNRGYGGNSQQRKCQSQCDEVNSWTVDQVCDFVGSIDICSEYIENFREQRIDGTGLPLLTEDHLTNSLGMKLGPALKLKSVLAKKSGGPCPCVSCSQLNMTHSPSGSIPRPCSADSGT